MRDTKYRNTKLMLTALAALAASSVLGCAGDTSEQETLTEPEAARAGALAVPGWTFCANQRQRCDFTGIKQVRFGNREQSTTRIFRDGVVCSNSSFDTRFGRGNTCEIFVEAAVDASVSAPSHEHPAATDAGVPVGDEGAHVHVPTTDAGAASMGPYIDNAAIPQGNPGVSAIEVRATSEQPVDSDVGAFRTSCSYSHMNYDDPIVFPGQPGKAHLHTYFGNTAVNAHSTAESIRSSGNSTCRGGIANRSAYWVPSIVDRSGAPLIPQSAQVYYKSGYAGIAPQEVRVFPQGLRMIAGNAKSNEPGQTNAYWGCETYIGHPNAIPDCPSGEVVILTVVFPQCWNGTDLDSADHKSHMSYPISGDCPSSHPYAMPEISFNIRYRVPAGTRSSEWRLSSDMYDASKPGGYSAHGDWFEGWDRQIAETFVKNCDQASKDCHSHLLGDGRAIFNSLEPLD